jgi:hypothetical protein
LDQEITKQDKEMFAKRDGPQSSFHNLSHLTQEEGEEVEEEYEWAKKRNAKLKLRGGSHGQEQEEQQAQEKSEEKNDEREEKQRKVVRGEEKIQKRVQISEPEQNAAEAADKENLGLSSNHLKKSSNLLLGTPKKESKEEKVTRVLTPYHPNKAAPLQDQRGPRGNVKRTFASPIRETKESFPSDDIVKAISPVIERFSSKLSLNSFSDSKESSPVAKERDEKYLPDSPKDEIQLTPKPCRKKKIEEEMKGEEEQDQQLPLQGEEEGEGSEDDDSPPLVEAKYGDEDFATEQLFSKVRHNRIKQVTALLEEGFDPLAQVGGSPPHCQSLSLIFPLRIAMGTIFSTSALRTISHPWPPCV